ncbi:MAG TPA: beta-galactosidase [Polyangiaceae bacterium]
MVPLVCGAMHYWRLEPSSWGPGLDAMRAMGMRVVETYVPWGAHEVSRGMFDFGQTRPRLDVARFLRMVHERGMLAIVRPGPHINAELTYFGLPERVVWDSACQAKTPQGNPVMLPLVPVGFPVPSYASEAFHEEVEGWFEACIPVLSPLRHPEGPIVMVQVDNEGALYFRDGAYDQDYHPDSLQLFRDYLRVKYKRPSALRAAWGDADATFSTATPPVRFDAEQAEALTRHLDWAEYQEHLLATAFERMGKRIAELGLDGIPTMHNFPLGEAATPLNPGRLYGAIDLVGLDYYHHATPGEHAVLMRRTTELVARAEGREVPAFGAEMGVGFPPFFAPHDEKDSLYALFAALAYGLRGFNLYMAVERDRWIGAPIDSHGNPRPLADVYNELCEALDRVKFFELRRRAPVRLVVPRLLRRLARISHAFGPITPAVFQIMGAGTREAAFEENAAIASAESWIRAFERALLARGVPFAYAGGETLGVSTEGARWILCATADGLKPEVIGDLRARERSGCRVTLGPVVPTRDGSWRPLAHAADVRGLEIEPLEDIARADALVARRIEELGLPTFPVDPPDAHVAVHEDASGAARLVFVMNPTPSPIVAKIGVPGPASLVSLLGEPTIFPRVTGGFEIAVPARTVRILEAR